MPGGPESVARVGESLPRHLRDLGEPGQVAVVLVNALEDLLSRMTLERRELRLLEEGGVASSSFPLDPKWFPRDPRGHPPDPRCVPHDPKRFAPDPKWAFGCSLRAAGGGEGSPGTLGGSPRARGARLDSATLGRVRVPDPRKIAARSGVLRGRQASPGARRGEEPGRRERRDAARLARLGAPGQAVTRRTTADASLAGTNTGRTHSSTSPGRVSTERRASLRLDLGVERFAFRPAERHGFTGEPGGDRTFVAVG